MALNFKHIKERAMQCIDTHDIDEMKRLQGMIEGECGNSLSLCHTIIENEKVFALVNFRDYDFTYANYYIVDHNEKYGTEKNSLVDIIAHGASDFVACNFVVDICLWLARKLERVEYDTPQLLCLYTALRNERAFLGDGTGHEVESQQGEEEVLSLLNDKYFWKIDECKAFLNKCRKGHTLTDVADFYYKSNGIKLYKNREGKERLMEILIRLNILPPTTKYRTFRGAFKD